MILLLMGPSQSATMLSELPTEKPSIAPAAALKGNTDAPTQETMNATASPVIESMVQYEMLTAIVSWM